MKTLALGTLAVLSLIAAPAAGQAPARSPAGVRGDILAQFDDAANKLIQLAEAIPADKFSWRPGTGVRSVSQVLMHVAGANYYVLSFAGVKSPEGLPQDGENSVTDKAQVIAQLKRSVEFTRAAIRAMSDAELDKPATMFGQQTNNRNVLFTVATHAHEHLGQLIAYARTNSVVPPWSRTAGSGGGQ
jgi:uncharacterized damage-inducible protein DinB